MPPVLLFFLTALRSGSPEAAVVDCGKPKFMQQKPAVCAIARRPEEIKPCAEFRALEQEAFSGYAEKMSEVCTYLNTNSKAACTSAGRSGAAGQQCVEFETSRLSREAAARLGKVDEQLAEYHRRVEQTKKSMLDAIAFARSKSCPSVSGIPTPSCQHPYRRAENGPDPLLRGLRARMNLSSPSDIPGTNPDPKSIFREQKVLSNEMLGLQREITREREYLKVKAGELERQAATTAARAERLGQTRNPGDGREDEPPGEKQGGGQEKQAGGGSPGGGSPGGGGGQPSNVTDQGSQSATSPTPDNKNNGGPLADDSKKGNSDGGKSANAPERKEPVDIGSLKAKGPGGSISISPSEPGSGRALASAQGEKNQTAGASQYGATPASAQAGGSGAAPGGGGGGPMAAPDSAPERAAAASPSGSHDSFGGSGGYSGGGSSGGGDDSPFNKPLGDPKMDVAGGEGDSSMKEMLDEMSAASNESLGSEADADGIGGKYGSSLFERAKSCHDRCLRKSCVSGLLKNRMEGE